MRPLLAAGAFLTAGAALASAATPVLTVESITRGGQPVTSAPDVTVRALDGSLLRQGIRVNELLPDDVSVTVPADVRVLIGAGGGKLSIENATDALHYTGKYESISMLGPGRTNVADPTEQFRFFGPGFELAVRDGGATVVIADRRATVTRERGTVTAAVLGSTAFVRRVDVLTSAHPSMTYTLGAEAGAAVTVDDDKALAANGDANGEFNLGMRYYWGDGVTADAVQTLRWLQAAAAQRFAEAENGIGYAYVYGSTSARDAAKAFQWFQLAANDGSGAAEDTLGDMYNYGHGVVQSYSQAMHWYLLASAQADADAENDVGLLYFLGRGSAFGDTEPDYARALHWFWIAAAQGNGDAENDLGYMYEHGDGLPTDYALALRWFRIAAAQRDRAAEESLGLMYERGRGVPQDNAQALYWYRLAAAQGLASASAAIERIESSQPHP
ncbi:MAG TPA: tetratricopeptide repeat protein [Candidatus Cybelea sp.]|nr:tetratricopeptide repeat protein [Candidatus Cybelea sp.]